MMVRMSAGNIEFSEVLLPLTPIRVRREKSKPAGVEPAGDTIPEPANAEVQGDSLEDERQTLGTRQWAEAKSLALQRLATGLGDPSEHLAYVRSRLARI